MTDGSTLGRTAWRDWNTDGVSSTGAHKPLKEAIRAFVDAVDLVVATRAAFRALTRSPEAILVRCNAAVSDGWGGVFFRDDDDTTTLDDGAYTIVTAAGKRYKRQFTGNVRGEWHGMPPGDTGAVPRDAALKAAIAAAQERKVGVELPGGKYLIDGSTGSITFHEVALYCTRVPMRRGNPVDWSAYQGTNFLVTSQSVRPFLIRQSVLIEGLTVFYPDQTGRRPGDEIIAYPPTFSNPDDLIGNQNDSSDIVFRDVSAPNAYRFWEQRRIDDAVNEEDKTPSNYGNIRLESCNIYGILTCFELERVSESFSIDGCVFNPANFFEGANLGDLLAFTLENGTWLKVKGVGTHSAANSVYFGGLQCTRMTVVAYRWGIDIDGGQLDECEFDDTCFFDQVQTIFRCQTSGHFTRLKFGGKEYGFRELGGAYNAEVFLIDNPADGGVSGTCDFQISATFAGGNGTLIKATGANVGHIDVRGCHMGNWGMSSIAGTYYAIDIDAANAKVNITGNSMFTGASSTKGTGVRVTNSTNLAIVGNNINGANRPIDTTGNAGRGVVSGNTTTNTQSTFSAYGTVDDDVLWGQSNNFDKPNRSFDGILRTRNSNPLYFGGGANNPSVGFGIRDNGDGTYAYGKGASNKYGFVIRSEITGGALGFFGFPQGNAGSAATGTQYLYVDVPGAQIVVNQLASNGPVIAATVLKSGSYTVATLPGAGAVGAGARALVTNANATTFASTVAGGGSNIVPVYSDGTNWKIG